jgi:hypothetical protein
MSETAITLYDKIQNPIEAAKELGKIFAKSGMFGCEKEEQGQLLALACMASKKDPFQFLDENHLIGGRRSMRADRMLANYRARGGKVAWKQFDDKAAIGEWTFEGQTTEIGFTFAEAERAGLIRPKSAWTTFPAEMLRARCIGRAVRMLCPEAIAGAYLPDERPVESDTAPAVGANQSAPLFVSQPKPVEPEAPAMDVAAEVTEAAPPEPVPEPASAPAPALNGDYMDFMKIIKGHEEDVYNWMIKTGKIKSGQKISDAPRGLLEKARQNPAGFLKAVGVENA